MPRAERDMEEIFDYIHAEISSAAFSWFTGLVEAIESLSTFPDRNPSTPENATLRHLLYGSKPNTYRIIYFVDRVKHTVSVIHVRHSARDALQQG